MLKRLSTKKIKSLQEQRHRGYSVTDIARKENLAPQKVYYHTDLIGYILNLGCRSRRDHREDLVRQRINPETGNNYRSMNEYNDYQARQRINPKTGRKYASLREYNDYQARQRINPKTGRKYASLREYDEYLAEKRKKTNKKLGRFLINRLEELEKNQSWLAKKIKVTKATTSFYIQGKITPSDDLLKKMSVSLKVNYKTLEDLIE